MMDKKEIYIDKISGEELTKTSYDNGDIIYYNNKNQYHRVDGPSTKYKSGYTAWYQNGKRHRLDGSAIEDSNGDKYWYIKGKEYTELQFNIHLRKLKMENL